MKKLLLPFFLVIAFLSNGQDLHKISLGNFTIAANTINFRISEVIDARKDKNIVGIIQKGLNNKKDFAVFGTPGLKEVEDMLRRSGLLSDSASIAIRIRKIHVSEITQVTRETAKAELSMDFFLKMADSRYAYVTSVYTTTEPQGLDVTSRHPANIINTFQQAFVRFAQSGRAANQETLFTYEELTDPDLTFKQSKERPLVLTARQYKDGFYASFEEFIANSPSISMTCEINFGKKIKIRCEDRKEKDAESIYGFAKDNKLYVLFHRQFYQLQREDGIFFFEGPQAIGQAGMEAMYKGWMVGGAVAGAAAASKYAYNDIYVIDLNDGSIKNLNGF